jgi:hypothetical protein
MNTVDREFSHTVFMDPGSPACAGAGKSGMTAMGPDTSSFLQSILNSF